uniref:Glucose-methanol-choline oxidoreductase C-terminal domain-containing protein n=1 Tax=Timema douglasi TaxID=61478 RepID=A0A7R8VH56_TIMDO|nr:unnamed protein product [Timema douglasi]
MLSSLPTTQTPAVWQLCSPAYPPRKLPRCGNYASQTTHYANSRDVANIFPSLPTTRILDQFKSHYRNLGVPVVYNLPRVGKNLVNHVSFTLNCWVSGETAYQRLNNKTLNQFLHTRSGPMASTGLSQRVAKELMCFEYQLTGFVRLNLSDVNTPQSLPDIQVFFAGYMANDSSTGCLDETVCDGARYINIVPTLLRPRSKGELTLKSSDAMEPPSIKANYLQHQEDVDYLIEAIRFCERLIQTEPMRRKGVKLDTVPVAGCQHLPHGSRNYWECALRHLTNPENHQVGTCAMGRSEMDSVLDSRLRVHGLKGLRVIDASAIPMVPSGNINAPIIMLAERGADFIKQEHDAFLAQPAFKRSNIMNDEGNFSSVISLSTCYKIPAPATAMANASDNPNLTNAVRPYQGKVPIQSSTKNLSIHQDPIISSLKARYVQVVVGLILGRMLPSKMPNVITIILGDILLRIVAGSKITWSTVARHQLAAGFSWKSMVYLSLWKLTQRPALVLLLSQCTLHISNNFLCHIHLDWNNIFPIKYVQQVKGDVVGLLRNKYPSVFNKVQGDIKGVEVNVVLKEGAIPVFYGPRTEVESDIYKISLVSLGPLIAVQVAAETRKDPILTYRNTPHTFTKVTPAELFLGRKPRIKLSLLHPSMALKQRVKEAQAKYTASQSSKVAQISQGDLVWVRSVTNRKLKAVTSHASTYVCPYIQCTYTGPHNSTTSGCGTPPASIFNSGALH